MLYLIRYMNCCVNTLICWLAGCQNQLCVIKGMPEKGNIILDPIYQISSNYIWVYFHHSVTLFIILTKVNMCLLRFIPPNKRLSCMEGKTNMKLHQKGRMSINANIAHRKKCGKYVLLIISNESTSGI